MARILVTGATGFTGKALCQRLVNDGNQVIAFVRATSKTDDLIKMGVECRVVDIKDRADIQKTFDRIDRVYHIAAAYRTEYADHDEFKLINVEATRNLLEVAKLKRVERFIHCSTVGVHGEIKDPPADESYRVQPGDHYQESKLEGELMARDYFSAGLPGTVIRPVGIYGPGDRRFLKLFQSINRRTFLMIGDGNVLYHMTYIDDLIEGIVLAGQKQEALNEVFIIAGETYTTIRELVNMIADILGKPHPKLKVPFTPVYLASAVCDKVCRVLGISPPLYPRRVEFFQLDRAFSIAKAKRLLDYQPKVSLKEGLKRTAIWYRQHGLL